MGLHCKFSVKINIHEVVNLGVEPMVSNGECKLVSILLLRGKRNRFPF